MYPLRCIITILPSLHGVILTWCVKISPPSPPWATSFIALTLTSSQSSWTQEWSVKRTVLWCVSGYLRYALVLVRGLSRQMTFPKMISDGADILLIRCQCHWFQMIPRVIYPYMAILAWHCNTQSTIVRPFGGTVKNSKSTTLDVVQNWTYMILATTATCSKHANKHCMTYMPQLCSRWLWGLFF